MMVDWTAKYSGVGHWQSGEVASTIASGSSVFVEVDDETVLTDAAADPLLSTARHLSIVRPVAHGPVDA